MKHLLPLLLLFICHLAHSQRPADVKEYMDENWKPVSDSSKAAYYRITEQEGDGWNVKDYFITGELQMAARCSEIIPDMVKDGPAVFYYRNGKVQREGNYVLDRQRGLFKEYYENGQMESEMIYTENAKDIHLQHWTEEGKPLLTKGKGLVSVKREKSVSYMEIADSVLVNSYSVENGTTDTVYTFLEVQPEYKGGFPAMMEDIRANLRYPKSARRHGIAGIVYISFVIDPDGNVVNPYVIKGIYPDCDEAALEAVRKLKKWNPGRVRNRAVFVRFALPIKFRLT